MEPVKFNPYDWLPKPQSHTDHFPINKSKSKIDVESDIETVVCRIESSKLDLTLNYFDWLSIGFSLAASLGETGREYFHRVSRFHPDYNLNNCNLQFDRCLKRQKSGISIKTFFYLAQSAGIDIRVTNYQNK